MRQLGSLTGTLARAAARRRGFTEAEILARWAEIVPAYAAWTRPVRIWQGTLTIATSSSSAAHNMTMQGPALIDRINQFFGYGAVQKLKFKVRPLLAQEAEPLPRLLLTPNDAACSRARARCAQVTDPALRAALTGLGALVEMDKSDKNVHPVQPTNMETK